MTNPLYKDGRIRSIIDQGTVGGTTHSDIFRKRRNIFK